MNDRIALKFLDLNNKTSRYGELMSENSRKLQSALKKLQYEEFKAKNVKMKIDWLFLF